MIWTNYAWDLVFVCCIELELSIDSERRTRRRKSLKIVLSIAGIFQCVIEMLYDIIREIVLFVIKKSILCIIHTSEHNKMNSFWLCLKLCISTVIHLKVVLSYKLNVFVFVLNIDCSYFLNMLQMCSVSFLHVIICKRWIYFHFRER